jgi:uncharacterized protein (UPF0179 family)
MKESYDNDRYKTNTIPISMHQLCIFIDAQVEKVGNPENTVKTVIEHIKIKLGAMTTRKTVEG